MPICTLGVGVSARRNALSNLLKLYYFTQTDRMAADMAVELRKQNVACISLWPGAVKTELIQDLVLDKAGEGGKVIIFDSK